MRYILHVIRKGILHVVRKGGDTMTARITAAQVYRDAARIRCLDLGYREPDDPGVDAQLHLYTYLKHRYQEEHVHLQESITQHLSDEDIETDRIGVAMLAVGMLAFGHLEATEDILQGLLILVHGEFSKIPYLLANSLKALLPLPAGMEPRTQPLVVQAWLQAHADRLVWDEATEQFVFDEAAAS